MEKFKIIYEDDNLIGVYKAYGVLSTDEEKESLKSILSDYRKSNNEEGYIGVVHRLDRTTQGVIIFSKNTETTKRLNKLIIDGEFHKEYLCVVEGVFDKEYGQLDDLLFFDRHKNKSYIVKKERKGVKKASLEYKVESVKDNLSLVRVKLLTGRTHQIRVQLGSRKHPIVGDRRYGSKVDCDNIMLCSVLISFINPYTDEKIEITYNPDNDYFSNF